VVHLSQASRSHWLLAILVLGHSLAISWQIETDKHVSVLEQLLLAGVAPFQNGLAGVMDSVGGVFHSYVDLRNVRKENRKLHDELDRLQFQLQARVHEADQADRLRALLDLHEALPLRSVAAEVIAGDGFPWASSIIVDKGSRDGVRLNMAALSPAGIVGRVIGVGPGAARVQLIVDRDSGVGVQVERNRTLGVLDGAVRDGQPAPLELPMRFVPALSDVQVGDMVVTSGLDQIYPKGYTVGRVTHVSEGDGLVKDVLVAPAVAFDKLDEVVLVDTPRAEIEPEVSVR
jgi:rod shape-determining protein MreC